MKAFNEEDQASERVMLTSLVFLKDYTASTDSILHFSVDTILFHTH